MAKRLLLPVLSVAVVILGTLVAIQFAKGYRPDFKNGNLKGTGLLVANSFPDGAQVFLNSKLTTATDTTLNLPPGEYDIEIKKDGYTPWKKHVILKAELVTQTNATLFPSVPTLKPLTFTGTQNPIPSPDGLKVAYLVENASNPSKNGLWVLDLSDHAFGLDREPRQLTRMIWGATKPQLTWSPDGREIVLSVDSSNYLLDATRLTDSSALRDTTAQLPVVFSEWEETLYRNEVERMKLLPQELQAIITKNATNLYFSPDEEKLLYTATQDTTIPQKLIPDLPAESTQKEERTLQTGATYVYDLKEDKNFRVLDPAPAELGKEIVRKISLVDPSPLPSTSLGISTVKLPRPTTSQASASANQAQSGALATHHKLQQKTIAQTIATFNAYYSPLSLQNIQWFPSGNHLVISQDSKIVIKDYDNQNPATIYAAGFDGNFALPWPNNSQLLILTNLNQGDTAPANLYSLNLK